MSSANNHSPSANPFPLAIVGIGCRFPGEANDVESFWSMLIEGRSGISEVPPDRWSLARYYHPDRAVPGAIVTRYGGFISGVDQFDAAFWGMSQREAIRMDPQQRWLLEAAFEALENSGTSPRKVRGTQVGVFVGISTSDYAALQMPNIAHADVHTISGTTLSIAANRVSYMLDLQGPSLSVDTACSSSLVAVWLAGRSIWSGACDSAIVGGVNALIIPETTLGFSKASMLSPDGQCFAFDARANGYVRGEGVGVIYIKPLDRALADGNRVYAVLRGAASNQDGHTSSMTVPSADGQAALLREAYQQAGVDPRDVVYIEAHGTGTPVGDPIEAAALGCVVGARRTTANACLIGSVKANIGHLEAGSGIAGLIKAALILHKEQIPPNQNFTAPNPQIPFDELGLRVVSRLQALPKPAVGKPVIGVNSFGFGGSNAHVVLEQAPAVATAPTCESRTARPQLLTISGASAAALRAYVEKFHSLLAEPDLPLADACYTAAARKEHHEHRLAAIGQDASEMRQRLEAWLAGGATLDGLVAGRVAPARSTPVFVYSGQGGQWWRMGRDLLEREPVFRQAVEQIDVLLKGLTDWSLIEEMMRPEAESRIDRTDIAQPTIFALQVALTELWRSWGVRPGRVVGHSVGEVAAAYVAEIYSLADAVKLSVHRARLQHATCGAGRMAAVGVSPGEAALAIGPDADCVHVAAVNGSKLVTLAGDTKPLEEIVAGFERSGKFVRWLRVAYAFHTHLMDPLRDELVQVLADIRPRPTSIPFVSTVTAGELVGTELTAEYWWRNIRQPVLFYPAVEYLVRQEADVFLEVGPHPALTSSIKECLGALGRTGAVVHSLRRGFDESHEMLVNLAGLHLADVAPDWGVVTQSRRLFHRLPSYPWQRETHWLESKQSHERRLSAPEHPLLGLRTSSVRPTWRAEWNLRRLSYLGDHRFWGSAVFPAAGHVEIGAALAKILFPNVPYVVENLRINKAIYLSDDKTSLVQVEFDPENKTFSVFTSVNGEAGDEWNLHAQGQLTRLAPRDHEPVDRDDLRRRLPDYLSHEDYYRDMIVAGYQFGPNFKLLQKVWRKTGEMMGEVVVPERLVAEGPDYCLHPTVTDVLFQLFKGLDPTLTSDDFFLPASVRRVRLTGVTTPPSLWVHGRLIEREKNSVVCDACAYDDQGRLVAEILGLCVSRVEQHRTKGVDDESLYRFHWEPTPARVDAAAIAFPPSAEITAAAKADLAEAAAARQPTAKQAGRTYVVLADTGGVGRKVGDRLSQMGHQVVYVHAGEEYQRMRAGEYVVDASSADHLRQVRDEVCRSNGVAEVVHCWCLDHPPASTLSLDTLWASQRTGLLSATQVMLIFSEVSRQPIWFITRDCRHVADGDGVEGVASSPLVGLLRVANNELFPGRFGQLDLDGPPDAETLSNICAEITDSDGELEIAYRRGRRHVLRLGRVQADRLPVRKFNAMKPGGQLTPFRLQTSKPGVLTNLALHETRRRAPEPHEVEVRVRACGVNFRDALKALGIYPGNARDLLWFGDDISGVVERVGKDVCHLQPGDAVVGSADYALQAFVTHSAIKFVKMQRNMSFEQAATVPTVFFTAHYALNRLARMQHRESILIHAGAGGVGQAALQVAKHLGLRIFATAGSPEKRRICLELGAHHVMSSRNLDFADEIMAITEGRGVDAVLNSLAGDFIPKSLSVLAPFGRFLEIGKIDVYKNTRLGLEALRNNISFFVIDALPAFSTAIFEEIRELLEAGVYRPIMHTCFPVTEAAEAFRQIAQGTSIGKNVLSFDHSEIPIGLCTEDVERFDADATYLIAGGAGGFGLEVADWMGRRGAQHVALLSRSGPRDEEARQKIENLRLAGVHVLDLRGDVANLDDVKRCVVQVAAVAPLKGVIHAAMVLDDDFLGELNEDRFRAALAPKMAGAWNLHVATIGQPLEHFISFSSVSSVIGAPKQANYNAGNSFLEGLAHHRRARGLPALTINWGFLLGAGYVERNRATARFLESAGQRAISIAEALKAFGRFTLLDIPQVVAARVDWLATSKLCSSMTHAPTWSSLMQETSGAARGGSLIARLNESDADASAKLVEAFVAAQLAEVVGVKAESIDYDISLSRLGLDSLMALELANRLERELGTSLQMASLLGGPSIKVLAQKVLKSLACQSDSIQSSESHGAQPATTIATPLNAALARDLTSARRNSGHAAKTSGSGTTFLRVLGGAEAERELSRQTFEAAALLYAPDRLKTVGGLSDKQIPALLGEQPFVSHIYELAYGKIGVVTLPVLGKDLLRSPRLPELMRSAVDLARQYGARCVSLTGLIPSATRYGLDVQEWLGAPTPTITTGHATTTAAVILNLESLLLNAGRSLQDETLAVLGLGSIGQTCLELAMRVLPHPRSIYLCDIFGKLKNLKAIAERLRDEYGYPGQVEVLLSADKLPAEFYRATTILTAVSVPNLIDVDRVRPGAILIDDSYPPAFALDQATNRAETKGDLLFSNAGMSRVPDPIRETVFLSQAAGEEMERYGAEAFRAEFVRDPRELTACFLSSLLTNRFEGFCPTLGLASPDDVLSHFHGLIRMGIGPARPQCGNYLMPDEIVRGFRRRFGSSRLGELVTR